MYLGYVVSDAFLTYFVSQMTGLLEDINVAQVMKQFPQTETFPDMMTVDKLKQIMPDVADRYDDKRPITARFNPSNLIDSDEEVKTFLSKNNKITFKKDALDFNIAIALEL